MGTIRQLMQEKFSGPSRAGKTTDELEKAFCSFLEEVLVGMTLDGWGLFRVVQESDDQLDAVGLMWLLPGDSVPIAISVAAQIDGLSWSVQVGRDDDDWRALMREKRLKSVYLSASGELQEPRWTWNPAIHGLLPRA